MHLRRAMILFAVVLGLAALATAVSQPRPREARRAAPAPAPVPSAPRADRARDLARVAFRTRGRPRTRRVATGQAAEVTVAADRPGQVQLEGLGLSAAADELTPARLDVLATRPQRVRVLFTPAGSFASERVGLLVVTASR